MYAFCWMESSKPMNIIKKKKKKKKMTGLSAYPFWANFWLCSKVFAFMHIAAFNFV